MMTQSHKGIESIMKNLTEDGEVEDKMSLDNSMNMLWLISCNISDYTIESLLN